MIIGPNHRISTTENTDNKHIHNIANRISLGGQVYDTTFVGNLAVRVAEELSRKHGLTIANEVRSARPHRKAQADPERERTKQQVRSICYALLDKHRGKACRVIPCSSTSPTNGSTSIAQIADSVVDTALDTAESLLSETGEVTALQTHGADYAEIVWQRRLRNQTGKKKRGRGI